MQKLKAYLAAVVLGLLFLVPPCAAADGLTIVRSFSDGQNGLAIATFTDGPRTVGLLGMSQDDKRISFVCGRGDWELMTGLVARAAAAQGGAWVEVGRMAETGTKTAGHLVIFANQEAVRFVISNASHGTYEFILPRSSLAEFLTQSAEAVKVMTE